MSNESQWSGPSSDTGNVLNSTPLNALLSGNGAAVGFSINYERVPQAIVDLEHAAKFFRNRSKVAEGLANIPAPGLDGVSLNAVTQIGKWASDTGENNLAATPCRWREAARGLGAEATRGSEDLPAGGGAEHPDRSQPGTNNMRTRPAAAMIVIGLAITLAGCGGGQSAAPESARPSPSQAASPIPPVTKNARDVAAMSRRPCELLTAQQANGFGLDLPPEQMEGLLGTLRCEWITTTRERETVRTVDVSMFTNNPTLEALYSRRQSYPFFELTEVAGYPAIVRRTNADDPSCDIDIKPAERQSVSVGYRSKEFNENPQQACEINKQVASVVLMNLPPKS